MLELLPILQMHLTDNDIRIGTSMATVAIMIVGKANEVFVWWSLDDIYRLRYKYGGTVVDVTPDNVIDKVNAMLSVIRAGT